MRRLAPRRRIWAVSCLFGFASFLGARASIADDLVSDLGGKRQLVLGELAGMQISTSGTSFSGPIGLSFNRYLVTDSQDRGNNIVRHTSFWFQPAADYFVVPQVSLGGRLEFTTTVGAVDVPQTRSAATTFDLPTTTTLAILVRGGYMIRVGARFGVWPRIGFGYRSEQSVENAETPNIARKATFSAPYFGTDVTVLWRANETVFFGLTPEFATTFSGSHVTNDVSTYSSATQFGIRGGLGVLIDL